MALAQLKLRFLPSRTPTRRKTKKEQELEDLEARAHAAKVSHRRAGRGYEGRLETSTVPSTTRQQDSMAKNGCPRLWSPSLACIKTGPLDPFLRLPLELDMRERNMLYFYLDWAPRIIHGLKPNPVYCPVRECSLVSMTTNGLFLHWVLFSSEMVTCAPTSVICKRRATIYAGMRALVQDETNLPLDTTYMLLAAAGLAEHRMGNVRLAHKHFTGAVDLIKMHGGLATFQKTDLYIGLGMVHCFTVQDVPLFRSRDELDQALERLSMPRGTVIDIRIQKFFGADTLTGVHIANLHMLNMLTANEPEGFVDLLVDVVLGSGDNVTQTAMTFLICSTAVKMGQWYGPAPALRTWETIEFVRLLSFAVTSREAVARCLSGWLLGAEPKEVDLSALKEEIVDGWELSYGLGMLSI